MEKSKAYYLDETDQLKKLTEEETEKLFLQYFEGDASVLNTIFEGNLHLVLEVIADMDISENLYMDAVQEGNMALYSAITEINETEMIQTRFRAAILNAVEDFLSTEDEAGKSGNELAARLNVLDRVCTSLADKYGREATVQEVASVMQMDEDDVRYLMKIALTAIKKD